MLLFGDVAQSLKNFRKVASKNGVSLQWIGRVESTINTRLKSWGEAEGCGQTAATTIGCHNVNDVRLELSFKGNYHLYATIDAHECKFIVGKSKAEYFMIEEVGIDNVTQEQLISMVKKYLLANEC